MQKDYKRLIRKFMNLGDTKDQAEKNAKQMIDYYAHTYRDYE